MARRETIVYVSDLTNKEIADADVMTVRIESADEKQRSYWTLDVAKSEISELLSAAQEHKKRGRAPGTKLGPRKPKTEE